MSLFQSSDPLTLLASDEVHVAASAAAAFAVVLNHVGPRFRMPDSVPVPMTLEPWPGGRWYRDLGNQDGHCWGQVQTIHRPTTLEITGPLLRTYPVPCTLHFRLSERDTGTQIELRYLAVGVVPHAFRSGLADGWSALLSRIRLQAEAGGNR